MQKLFICEYPYVLYKTLIKAVQNQDDEYDIIISNRMEDMTNIIPAIKKSGLFRNVYLFDSTPYQKYYSYLFPKRAKNAILDRLKDVGRFFILGYKQKDFKNIVFDFEVDLTKYDEIYCTDLAHVINGYLATNKIPFILVEHAVDIFHRRNYTLPAIVLNGIQKQLDRLNIITGMRTTTKYCVALESNSGNNLVAFCKDKRIIEWNVNQNIERLSVEQKDVIFKIYAEAYNLNIDISCEYNILLTNPLFNDGIVETEEEEILFYKQMINRHLKKEMPLIIKAHPRDTVDYVKGIPNSLIVNNIISSEILCLSKDLKVNTVIALYSSSLDIFENKSKELVKLVTRMEDAKEMIKKYVER